MTGGYAVLGASLFNVGRGVACDVEAVTSPEVALVGTEVPHFRRHFRLLVKRENLTGSVVADLRDARTP